MTKQATATQNANGTWKIEFAGMVIRKASKKLWPKLYSWGTQTKYMQAFSNSAEMRRGYGEPTVYEIIAK